ALAKSHFLAVDVSDARAVFTVSGDGARDVLARLCPVDLHPDSFGLGQVRRTRMAQIAAAFWMHDDGFDVVCFRSVADYAQGVLTRAATTGEKTGFFA
ncbi:MAG: sarcosine oxidase subunit gamma family protein, partial [Octadecabacter sp.]